MKTAIYQYKNDQWSTHPQSKGLNETSVQLVLCFGEKKDLNNPLVYEMLRSKFPSAEIVICSTAGQIFHNSVSEEGFNVTAIEFASTRVKSRKVNIKDYEDSFSAGGGLINQFERNDLA